MKFFLYCLCGLMGVLTDLIVYFISLKFGIPYLSANALGYLSGTIISFILNRKFTFGVHDKIALRFVIFICVAIVGFSVSTLMLWIMVGVLDVGEQLAKLFTLPVIVLLQFFLNKWLTFNEAFPLRVFFGKSE